MDPASAGVASPDWNWLPLVGRRSGAVLGALAAPEAARPRVEGRAPPAVGLRAPPGATGGLPRRGGRPQGAAQRGTGPPPACEPAGTVRLTAPLSRSWGLWTPRSFRGRLSGVAELLSVFQMPAEIMVFDNDRTSRLHFGFLRLNDFYELQGHWCIAGIASSDRPVSPCSGLRDVNVQVVWWTDSQGTLGRG